MWPEPGHLPELLRPVRPRVERRVGRLLGRLAVLAVDEEDGAVDLRHEALAASAGGRSSVKSAVGDRDDAVAERRRASRRAGVGEVVADGAAARALGDDRPQRGRLGRGLDHHLAADREADAADPLRVDVGPALEERDGRVDVARAVPAEECSGRPRSRPRRDGRRAGRRSRGGRAASREPACRRARGTRSRRRRCASGCTSPSAAGRRSSVNSTFSYGAPRSAVGTSRAGGVRDDVGDRDRHQHDVRDDERAAGEQQPARVAPPARVVAAARPPERRRRRGRAAGGRPAIESRPVKSSPDGPTALV